MLSNDNTVLAVIRISNWNGYRHDKYASQRTLLFNNSSADAGRFNKKLLPKEALISAKKTIQDFQKYIEENTLPYSGLNATRILPTASFLTFQAVVQEYREQLKKDVIALATAYEEYIEEAKVMLGTLFKASDYPTKKELLYKFFIGVTYIPVPVSENFNSIVGNSEITNLNEQIKEISIDAIRDLLFKTHVILGRLHSSLTGPSDRYFKTTVVSNINTIINQLANMVYLDAPVIPALHVHIKKNLKDINIAKLKTSNTYCNNIATHCATGLAMIAEYYDFD